MIRLLAALLATLVAIALPVTGPARADDRQVCFSIGTEDFKDSGYWAIGLAACERALKNQTMNAKNRAAYHRQIGDWKRRMGDLDAALDSFGRAIELDPTDHENFDYRAEVWIAKGNDGRALADFNAATRLKPDYPAAYLGRGDIYRKRGDNKAAEEEYRKLLAKPSKDRIDAWAHREARGRLEAMGLKAN